MDETSTCVWSVPTMMRTIATSPQIAPRYAHAGTEKTCDGASSEGSDVMNTSARDKKVASK